MKRVVFLSLLSLCALSLAAQHFGVADSDGPSATGSFQISADGLPTRKIEFDVRTTNGRRTVGEMTLSDVAPASDPNAGKDKSSIDTPLPFSMKANIDCLVVKGNRAMMSGSVTESSDTRYIGRRLILVAQDGDAFDPPERDKLTFGVYRSQKKEWLATDSERPDDGGGPVTWIAQDAERPEDEPALSETNQTIGCQSFPISSFSFIDAKQGSGKIQVRR